MPSQALTKARPPPAAPLHGHGATFYARGEGRVACRSARVGVCTCRVASHPDMGMCDVVSVPVERSYLLYEISTGVRAQYTQLFTAWYYAT